MSAANTQAVAAAAAAAVNATANAAAAQAAVLHLQGLFDAHVQNSAAQIGQLQPT